MLAAPILYMLQQHWATDSNWRIRKIANIKCLQAEETSIEEDETSIEEGELSIEEGQSVNIINKLPQVEIISHKDNNH